MEKIYFHYFAVLFISIYFMLLLFWFRYLLLLLFIDNQSLLLLWYLFIYLFIWMNKGTFTRAGLEPATSGLTCRGSTN